MVLFRAFSVGLFCASLIILAYARLAGMRPAVREPPVPAPERDRITVVDVAAGVGTIELPGLIRMDDDEHVSAVDDLPIVDDGFAAVHIVDRATHAGRRYVDLTITSPGRERRVLMLLH